MVARPQTCAINELPLSGLQAVKSGGDYTECEQRCHLTDKIYAVLRPEKETDRRSVPAAPILLSQTTDTHQLNRGDRYGGLNATRRAGLKYVL